MTRRLAGAGTGQIAPQEAPHGLAELPRTPDPASVHGRAALVTAVDALLDADGAQWAAAHSGRR
ncbi:hypothetical protein [Streptomyces sp. NPDC058671]|uniref:hypothetical protein n=1 Tax=Streptomyces sp. NPDC058671 TaxID=3346590 RepID=UPI0036661A4E